MSQEIISKPFDWEISVANEAEKITEDFIRGISNPGLSPGNVCIQTKKRIEKLAALWMQFKKQRIGRPAKSFFIDSIKKKVRFYFVVKKFTNIDFTYDRFVKKFKTLRVDYDYKLFGHMVSIQSAFHYAKFGKVELYEIKMAALIILLNRFSLFYSIDGSDEQKWLITSDDIIKVLMNITFIVRNDPDFYKYVKFRPLMETELENGLKKSSPSCAEDLLKHLKPGMNVNEWVEVLCEQWAISRRTVYRYFKKYSIDPKKLTKSN